MFKRYTIYCDWLYTSVASMNRLFTCDGLFVVSTIMEVYLSGERRTLKTFLLSKNIFMKVKENYIIGVNLAYNDY